APPHAPVEHASALGVAAPDDEVGAILDDRRQERWQRRRGMRPVGVHLDQGRGTAVERDAEAVEVRPPEAFLAGAVANPDSWLVAGPLPPEPARPGVRALAAEQQRH